MSLLQDCGTNLTTATLCYVSGESRTDSRRTLKTVAGRAGFCHIDNAGRYLLDLNQPLLRPEG